MIRLNNVRKIYRMGDELTVLFGSDMAQNFYDLNSRVWREPKIDLYEGSDDLDP